MNKETPFSSEYGIVNETDVKSSLEQKTFTSKPLDSQDIINTESEYQLSKPIRKTIRARIIKK